MLRFKKHSLLITRILVLTSICSLNINANKPKESLATLTMTLNSLTNKANQIGLLEIPASGKVEIINYNASYKDDIIKVALQNSDKLFGKDTSESENKEALLALLDDSKKIKRILMDSNQAIGFIEFFKVKTMIRDVSDTGGLFRLDDWLYNFAKIEVLVVSQKFRGKGYGKQLLRDAIDHIKKLWPDVKFILLDVQADNESAIKFYESEGFVKSVIQPGPLVSINSQAYDYKNEVQYEKNI